MSPQEIIDGVKKILEAPIFKGLFSFAGFVVTQLFGQPDAALQAFLWLLVIDLITGLLKAWMAGELKSFVSHEKGRKKYIGYGVTLMIAHLLDKAMIPGVRNIALFWGTATETISVVENLNAMGVPLPKFLLEQVQKSKEKYKI